MVSVKAQRSRICKQNYVLLLSARELLSYDPATGALLRKTSRPGVRVGTIAGRRTARGYCVAMIDME